MSWARLPKEIQLHIFEYLQPSEYKSLRLTNKSNDLAVIPKLFDTIHLTPNTRSFDRARAIVSFPRLSQNVKSLVFHVGVLEDVHNGFPAFRDDIMRLHHPSGNTEDITRDIIWKYNCFLEEMDGQRDFETRDELAELQYVCSRLGALESLTIILDEDDPFVPPTDFIGHRTGVQSACSADGSHFSSLVQAAVGKQLTTIRSWSTSWHCLLKLRVATLDSLQMQGMCDLALGLFNSEFLEMESDDQTAALAGLDAFLGKTVTTHNYTLQLDFDEIPFDGVNDELRLVSAVVFQYHWPRLKKLALQGIAATEDDIVRFLEAHCATLKVLHLDDIDIVDEVLYDVDGNMTAIPGSVVQMFRRISESLDIEIATITGNFTNRTDESWYVDTEDDSDVCLRRDIELWLVRKAPSPFDHRLLYRQTNRLKPESETTIQSDFSETCDDDSDSWRASLAETYSDASWVWDLDLIV